MRAGIEKNPGWDAPAHIWTTNPPICEKEKVQGKKRLWVKKRSLKTEKLVVKWDKLVTEKPGKSKQAKVARVELKLVEAFTGLRSQGRVPVA